MELFDDRVVLFESDEGGEYLLVTCEPSGMGGLVVRQTSEGPLTQWCFEESPHVVEEAHAGPVGIAAAAVEVDLDRDLGFRRLPRDRRLAHGLPSRFGAL